MTRNPVSGKKTLLNSLFTLPQFSSHSPNVVDDHYKYVLNLVNSGVLLIGATDYRVLWCNDALLSMTGYKETDVLGKNLLKMVPDKQVAVLHENLDKFIQTGQQQAEEYSILSASGCTLNVNVQSSLQEINGQSVIVASLNDVTHQLQVHRHLEDSAFETTALINSIDGFLWSMDRELNFQRINANARKMFSESFGVKTSSQSSFREVLRGMPDHSSEIWQEKITTVIEEGVAQRFEICDVFEGHFFHVKAKIQPILNARNEVEALSCHVVDDTEEYLRHRFLQVLDDFKTKIIGINNFEDVLWLVTDEILAKLDFEDAIILMAEGDQLVAKAAHGAKRVEDKRQVTPLVLKIGEGITGSVALNGKSEMVNDTRLDTRYLSRHFSALSEVVVPIKIEKKVIGVINCESQHAGFFTQAHLEILQEVADLVAGKFKMIRADHGLREMQMLNRAVLDSTPNSFLLLNPENRIRSFNRTASEVFEDVFDTRLKVGDDFWKFVPADFAHEFEELFDLAINGEIQKVEKSLEKPNLGKAWFAVTFAPAFNKEGMIFGVTIIIENISQKKRSEQLIMRQNEELRKANQELDKFVYSVSHDLRSPIANVMGLTTIIDACERLEEVQEYSTMIERTMHRMDDFIHNILDYSRNNRLEVNFESLDLHELVEELILDYYHIEGMKSIKFENQVSAGFTMKSDSQRVRIILGNLLSNAIKYHDAEKDKPTIEIGAVRKENMVELKVKDNGQGIDRAHLPKLFEMFYTANIRAEGSGIGLYILQDAVNLLGGQVVVDSELGQGTEFIISLPESEEI